MHLRRITTALGFASAAAAAQAVEVNAWPLWVGQKPAENQVSPPTATKPAELLPPEYWTSLGPLFFSQPAPPNMAPASYEKPVHAGGFRPLWVRKTDAAGNITNAYVLPPLFEYTATPFGNRWKIFQLIQHESPPATHVSNTGVGEHARFEIWPFYLSRQTGSPETSYRTFMPFYGSLPNHFGLDRWTWVMFPLYGKFEKNGVATTTAPWPFIKVLSGDGNSGFEFWPLFGYRHKDGVYREQFYLWPLIYKNESKLSDPKPTVQRGFLPFYSSIDSETVQSRTYVWPFFGWFDRTAPTPYHETHFLWPLFVQGRGENLRVNRWAPFYSFSSSKGVEKTWVLWPLWRRRVADEGPLIETKNQIVYFVFNSTVQRSVASPKTPPAYKVHLWPLFSTWNNGAGRRQIQALSPLEVFSPYNETVRLVYSPLFAIYRYDQPSHGTYRHSLLWNFITFRRTPQEREFHLGPILSTVSRPAEKRFALLGGVLGADRDATRGWRPFLFKFKRRSASVAASGAAPAAHP